MDADSFAAGGEGPGFHVGGNQMGDPNALAAAVAKPAAAPPEIKQTTRAVKYSMAKRVPRAEDLNAIFKARALKLGLSGLMILEVELDARAKSNARERAVASNHSSIAKCSNTSRSGSTSRRAF
jgi:hypothetical protein